MIKIKLIIIGLIFTCNISYSQCRKITDSLFLITLDIRSSNKYPIIMNGVSKTKSLCELNKTTVDSLLESFYKNAYFIPDIPNGMDRTILACLGDSLGHKYLKEHQLIFARLRNSISRNNVSTKFQLLSGETVYCNVVGINGIFWVMNKDSGDISTNSMEVPLKEISNISTCYIPFEIEVLKKQKANKK